MDYKYRQFREAWKSVDTDQQTTGLLLSRFKTWEIEDGKTGKPKKAEKSEEIQKENSGFKNGNNPNGKPKKTREEIAEIKKRTNCHLCKTKGHWAWECPEKGKQEKKEPNPSERHGKAYSAGSLENSGLNDSGANRHYCGNLEWFYEYVEYPCPKSVNIADSQLTNVRGRRGKSKSKSSN
jgi:hypothetical protein